MAAVVRKGQLLSTLFDAWSMEEAELSQHQACASEIESD